MQKHTDIPVLTELIEKGTEISMTDLGLENDLHIAIDDPMIDEAVTDITLPGTGPVDAFTADPGLEQSVRRILDEHMKLAWQEIRLEIQRAFDKSRN